MKRALSFILVVAIVFGLSSTIFACGDEMKGGAMGHGMMKGAMHTNKMVSSNDGGVIVMMGHMLLKYDKNLNLVKKVELQMPESMGSGMKMMEKGKCPICSHKMDKSSGKQTPPAADQVKQPEPEKK